jgi:hypothetical protein
MKNLKNLALNFDDPDDIIGVLIDINGLEKSERHHYHRHSTYHPIDNVWPGERVSRILEKKIGKQFSKAFSYYCSLVPVYQQNEFLDEFREKRHTWYGPDYYIDVNGNIQKTKRKKEKKTIIFYSDDYKAEKRHKITNRLKTSYYWSEWKNLKLKEEDFHDVVVSGYAKEFSSRKDPEYQKLHQEKEREKRRNDKIKQKEKELLEYSFLTKSEQEYFNSREANKLNILRHGFDYETSFRGY